MLWSQGRKLFVLSFKCLFSAFFSLKHKHNFDLNDQSLYIKFNLVTKFVVADVSDCESYGNKKVTVATQQLNITSSQASLHSVSSSQPDVHPFFKVCNQEILNGICIASVIVTGCGPIIYNITH